jgi:uncharacterized lipoprotein YbaY
MRRLGLATLAAGALIAIGVAANSPARAQEASVRAGQGANAAQDGLEASAQSRRRGAPTQLRVYRERVYLPPNAVRACDAWYEQEFRPSGTVIVPRMRCRWVAG